MTEPSIKKVENTASRRSAAAQNRFEQIIQAAVRLINERGYAGTSLQAVADAVGISQPGVLHYVGSKRGLLTEVIRRYYDHRSSIENYISLYASRGIREGRLPKIPEFCRLIVEENSRQPELVMLFQMLSTEGMSPASPLHEYFNSRSRNITDPQCEIEWSVPEGVDASTTLSCAMAAMYGLEGRWVARQDEIDYPAEWSKFEDVLFPLPLWEGYR